MAFQDQRVVDRVIQAYGLTRRTDRTIVDRLQLMAEFQGIRVCGYAVDREEAIPGAICFGGPILDGRNLAIGSLSISVPAIRVTDQRERELTEAVTDAARRASQNSQSAARTGSLAGAPQV
jgi:DNA-binding IclR family transcriptional regulator